MAAHGANRRSLVPFSQSMPVSDWVHLSAIALQESFRLLVLRLRDDGKEACTCVHMNDMVAACDGDTVTAVRFAAVCSSFFRLRLRVKLPRILPTRARCPEPGSPGCLSKIMCVNRSKSPGSAPFVPGEIHTPPGRTAPTDATPSADCSSGRETASIPSPPSHQSIDRPPCPIVVRSLRSLLPSPLCPPSSPSRSTRTYYAPL